MWTRSPTAQNRAVIEVRARKALRGRGATVSYETALGMLLCIKWEITKCIPPYTLIVAGPYQLRGISFGSEANSFKVVEHIHSASTVD
jgi:hypothetical protein